MSAKVTWNGPKIAADILKIADRAVVDAAEFLLEEANRTVPIEEGTLLGSGQVVVDRRNHRAFVTYDTPYAMRQHEDTRLQHDPGRRAKWLERTFIEQATKVNRFIADRIRQGMR